MECSICKNICDLPTNNTNNTKNIAIVSDTGLIRCLPCYEISDLLSNDKPIIKTIQKTTTLDEIKPIIKTKQQIMCPKCKKKFSEKMCNCGFKNPIYRS